MGLLQVLSANKDIKIEVLNKLGFQAIVRMNFLHPPFDNPKVRRAVFMAVNQKDFMDAMVGNDQYFVLAARSSSAARRWIPLRLRRNVKGTGMAEAKRLLAELNRL